jgi:hypothetical protein
VTYAPTKSFSRKTGLKKPVILEIIVGPDQLIAITSDAAQLAEKLFRTKVIFLN